MVSGVGTNTFGGGGGGNNGYGRVPGLPVVHPHGPLIRGNLVPRLLAPLPTGAQPGTAPPPLYAIVKPQQSQQAVLRPPVHVCVPLMAPKLGSAAGKTALVLQKRPVLLFSIPPLGFCFFVCLSF